MNDSSPSRSVMTHVCERGITQFHLKMQSTRLSTSEITQINHTYLNSPAAELCHKFDRYSFPVRRRIGGLSWPAVYQLARRRNFVCDDGDLSPPLLKVVVTVTTTFLKWKITNSNFSLYFGKRIVFFLLPEVFCGLKYAENAIVTRAAPRTPLGELTTLP